ncbi:MAG: hypothetical protein JW738_05355 [Actinobacteria bacterium]|nr:hypothetical protein [Actinomycetota bacterium]
MEEASIRKKIIEDLNAKGIYPRIDTVECVIHFTETGGCDGCKSQGECIHVFEAMADWIWNYLQGRAEDLDSE